MKEKLKIYKLRKKKEEKKERKKRIPPEKVEEDNKCRSESSEIGGKML